MPPKTSNIPVAVERLSLFSPIPYPLFHHSPCPPSTPYPVCCCAIESLKIEPGACRTSLIRKQGGREVDPAGVQEYMSVRFPVYIKRDTKKKDVEGFVG